MRELTDQVAKRLFVNGLYGLTDLCSYSLPRDLVAETTRDPGPAEV